MSQWARLNGGSTSARDETAVVADELFGGRYVIRGHWKAVTITAPFGDNTW
ncbi:hypothetical protein QTI66_32975 [Variovorax sp. J22R133]|uniref:hypothetical protein n=1 Tax=Variovorax brevis TaxID=3053503 RepID=UPI0025772715|nr:hypothetical protein [Variovorax sp. J22R133]MDM0116943.1 hypothetical protein [Variovorax sp. J22R133]